MIEIIPTNIRKNGEQMFILKDSELSKGKLYTLENIKNNIAEVIKHKKRPFQNAI